LQETEMTGGPIRGSPLAAAGGQHRARVAMDFSPYNLLAGFIFGTLGWGAFSYGRKLDLWQPRAIGLGLMIYPYFITNRYLLWGTGVALLVLLWFFHDE
jgi:hypothetical protein